MVEWSTIGESFMVGGRKTDGFMHPQTHTTGFRSSEVLESICQAAMPKG